MVQASLKYNDDPQLLLDIISAMPKRVDNTLTLYRNKLLGNIPKTREEFDPTLLLSKVEGGEFLTPARISQRTGGILI